MLFHARLVSTIFGFLFLIIIIIINLLQAFEHLLQRELISFTDKRGQNQSIEFHPVKLLVSFHELHQGLKSYRSCPVSYSPAIYVYIDVPALLHTILSLLQSFKGQSNVLVI